MDDITFRSDTVLSDIHLHMPNKSHLMVRLNAVGQPVFLSQFQILWDDGRSKNGYEKEAAKQRDGYCGNWRQEQGGNRVNEDGRQSSTIHGLEALLDDDGDLQVIRKPVQEKEEHSREAIYPIILTKAMEDPTEDELEHHCQDSIKIEHTMATPLEDVGKQIWRGAFLLADYLLWKRDLFKSCTALELGAGTGLTSIIMATVAKTVYCTDVGEDLLDMCERNIALNRHLRNPSAEVKVKELDWLKNEFCTDPETPYSWSEEEIADLYDSTSVIVAADVFYDDDLTDAVFRTFYRIVHNLKNPCIIYLSIERRLNFTLRHMDISCDAYNHFRKCLHDLQNITDGKMKFTAEPIKPSFPQFFVYERGEQLELWKVTTETLLDRVPACKKQPGVC